MGGPRMTTQQEAAAEAGIGLVGGIIHRDAETGRRTSRALVFDGAGELVATYEKLHLPEEPGFWEPATTSPAPGAHGGSTRSACRRRADLLGHQPARGDAAARRAQGAPAVLVPRATEETTYQRWKIVFRANALTTAAMCCR